MRYKSIKKDIVMNQCIRLTKALFEFSKTRPINEVKQATVGIVSILGNLRSVICFSSRN